MRRPGRVILSTWFAMLTLQTIGTIDGKHKLPAPKQYVVISVAYGTLFLLADSGMGRLAARLSMLMLLTATVLGPFGARLVKFLEGVSTTFAINPGQALAGSGAPTAPTAPYASSIEQPRR